MKARISHLHKTESEWAQLPTWVPEDGELVIYDADKNHDYVRIKIGDGKSLLKDLPFFIDSAIATYLKKQRHQEVIDGGRVTMFK